MDERTVYPEPPADRRFCLGAVKAVSIYRARNAADTAHKICDMERFAVRSCTKRYITQDEVSQKLVGQARAVGKKMVRGGVGR